MYHNKTKARGKRDYTVVRLKLHLKQQKLYEGPLSKDMECKA